MSPSRLHPRFQENVPVKRQLILLLGPIVVSTSFLLGCPSHAETPKAVQHDAEEVGHKVGEGIEKAGEKTKEAGEKVQEKIEEKKKEP
jgi:predicted RNase H-like HicB family nuclease